MSEQNANDFLIWVGSEYYSSEAYLKEAKKKGACRRVARVPAGIKVGVSRVFLISDMTEEDKVKYHEERKRRWNEAYKKSKETGHKPINQETYGKLPRGTPIVMAWYTIEGIAYITESPQDVINKQLQELGVTPYAYQEGAFGFNDDRECGSLKIGGVYLLSEADMEKVKELAESSEQSGNIHPIVPPVPFKDERFRGYRAIKHLDNPEGIKVYLESAEI